MSLISCDTDQARSGPSCNEQPDLAYWYPKACSEIKSVVIVDFLQVSMDAVPRIQVAIKKAGWSGPASGVLGWITKLWYEEISLLNNDRAPKEKAVLVSYKSLHESLSEDTKQPELAVDALLHALIMVGFFDRQNDANDLRLCGMSRYFELSEQRNRRSISAKKAGEASGKSRNKSKAYASNESFNDRSQIVEPTQLNSTQLNSSQLKSTNNSFTAVAVEPKNQSNLFEAQNIAQAPSQETNGPKPKPRAMAQKEEKAPAPPSEPKKEHFSNMPWADAIARLCEVFSEERGAKYALSGRDFKALETMADRVKGNFDEVETRWRNCLQSEFPVYGELWQCNDKFNQFAGAAKRPAGKPKEDPNQGILRAPPVKVYPCVICGQPGVSEVWGRKLCDDHRSDWGDTGPGGDVENRDVAIADWFAKRIAKYRQTSRQTAQVQADVPF